MGEDALDRESPTVLRPARDPEDIPGALSEAAEVLRQGGLLAYPTETFYGLAADIRNPRALGRLFEVKRRKADSPILILVPDMATVLLYARDIPDIGTRLMEAFWPGGLTLVFHASDRVNPVLTAHTGRIGIRLSSHPVATGLARALGAPITGTSANLSKGPPCTTAPCVLACLSGAIDGILDGGATRGGAPSTVLDVTREPVALLREGVVSLRALKRVLGGESRPRAPEEGQGTPLQPLEESIRGAQCPSTQRSR